MKFTKIISFILAAAMLCCCLAACGKTTTDPVATPDDAATPADAATGEQKTFTMGIDPEYPPFSYLDENGEYTGFDVEICKACCDQLGWNFEVFGVNWDEKLVQLDAKECDCVWSGMTILDSMKDAGYVISEPYFYNTQVLVVKTDSGITSSADLAGKLVAVQLGTSGESLLAEDGDLAELSATFGDIVTCESFVKCFAELDGNAVDAVFVDKPVADTYVSEHEGFTVINEELGAEQYGIAFRADDADMNTAIQGAIDTLVANGTYAEIAAKYPDIVDNLIFLNK